MTTTTPSERDRQPEFIVWLRPDQEERARRLIDDLGLRIAAVGAPALASFRSSNLLDIEASDDFRRTLADHPDAALLMFALSADERQALTHPGSLPRGVSSADTPIITLEPLAPSLNDVRQLCEDHTTWLTRVHRAPNLVVAPGPAAAIASLDSFGRVRSIDLALRSGGESSLAALLIDAMEFIAATLGESESIDASLSGLDASSGLRLTVGDTLTSVTGDLSAHLRFPDDRAAAISLSDRAGVWFRGATLLGAGGCIRFDDRSCEWIDPAGTTVDESSMPEPDGSPVDDLIRRQIEPILNQRAVPTPPTRRIKAYALAEAALLSARTGQPESPSTILRMAGIA